MVEPDSLHVVEGVEERIDEPGSHLHECGQLRLEQTIVVFVLARSEFKVLFDLKLMSEPDSNPLRQPADVPGGVFHIP
jgi:hypothetical protein